MLTTPEGTGDPLLRSDHTMPTIGDKHINTHLWIASDLLLNDHYILEAEVVRIFALHRYVCHGDSE